MGVEVRLRTAGPQDLQTLQRWDDEPHVLVSDPNDDWGWERELSHQPSWREQLIAEANGQPIGFIQIIDPRLEDSHYWGVIGEGYRAIDIWIGEADFLGRGYGTAMMKQALERCFSDPTVFAVLVDPLTSNEASHRFYQRLGFRLLERRRFGLDECDVHLLTREIWAKH